MKSRRAVDLENQKCPIRNVLDRIGDRWSLLVLLNLHEIGTMRFTVIKRAIDDISQRMLSQTLRRLEQDGLIARHVHASVPPAVAYSLTPIGKSLMPHIKALAGWADEHFAQITDARAAFVPPPAQIAL